MSATKRKSRRKDAPLHVGLPVHGYKPQSQKNTDLVNVNKKIEEMMLRRCDELLNDPDVDVRWMKIGITHIEEAFMAINRAIFKPSRIEGEL